MAIFPRAVSAARQRPIRSVADHVVQAAAFSQPVPALSLTAGHLDRSFPFCAAALCLEWTAGITSCFPAKNQPAAACGNAVLREKKIFYLGSCRVASGAMACHA